MVLGVFLALAASAGVGWFLWRRKSKKRSNASPETPSADVKGAYGSKDGQGHYSSVGEAPAYERPAEVPADRRPVELG